MNLPSLEATRELARMLLARLPAGSLLLLSGPLGAGKTTLVQQLGLELGSNAQISSPTYTLIHEYPTPRGALVHADAYRLADARELVALGLSDSFERARLVVVEWGESLIKLYPEALLVRLELGDAGRRAVLPSET